MFVLVGVSDNELFVVCGEIYGYFIKGGLWVFGSGFVVVCVWFFCVVFCVGVLIW